MLGPTKGAGSLPPPAVVTGDSPAAGGGRWPDVVVGCGQEMPSARVARGAPAAECRGPGRGCRSSAPHHQRPTSHHRSCLALWEGGAFLAEIGQKSVLVIVPDSYVLM